MYSFYKDVNLDYISTIPSLFSTFNICFDNVLITFSASVVHNIIHSTHKFTDPAYSNKVTFHEFLFPIQKSTLRRSIYRLPSLHAKVLKKIK
jgi:hypothetical protein